MRQKLRQSLSLCFLLICACSALLSAQHNAPGQKNPLADKPEAIRAGKAIYDQMCAGCHGAKGGGGRGPAVNSGVFEHGNEDAQIFGVIKNGVAGTAMPSMGLTDDEVWQLVTFLRSMGGSEAEIVTGNPAAGESILAGKANCLSCHMVNGAGSRFAPDLSTIGNLKAEGLRKIILKPGSREGYQSGFVEVKTKGGKIVKGLRRNEDTFSIQLFGADEEFHLINKKDVAEIKYAEKSIMPADYGQRLSESELNDLIAYLKSLKTGDLQKAEKMPMKGGLAYERIVNASKEPQNWLSYFGDYNGQHYSQLKQINISNVASLQTSWVFQPQGNGLLQASPLVVDGVMYTTGASNYAYALDAATGRQLWEYKYRAKDPKHDVKGVANRGLAMLGGRLFMTTGDAWVVALDAKTGRQLWEAKLAEVSKGYFSTMAPLALKDMIIVGMGGGELGVRGFLDAYDPATGKRLWRFNTVPGPGEFGNDTWEGDSWKTGAGATWMTGTYDAELDLIYWGIGNPGPDLNGSVRKGDNLFTCSVVAIEPATGKRRWHFQFTPHDLYDWDANETPMLVDRLWKGKMRKLMFQANRNGFFYVLDRESGDFLFGTPFARQTWAKGLEKNGRPILLPGKEPTYEGVVVYPNLAGATNWQSPSYDPETSWFILTYKEAGNVYVKEDQKYESGNAYWGGRFFAPGDLEWGGVKAIDPETGATKWDYRFYSGGLGNGLLATAGGVTFATSADGNFIALGSKTGKLLWRTQTGGDIHASPISYAVNGRQYVACSMGGVVVSFALPQP
ncbi:MAG: PQQ-dependent dehydrogenase, methanol/ethanol family [Acidobacteriota bacterium]